MEEVAGGQEQKQKTRKGPSQGQEDLPPLPAPAYLQAQHDIMQGPHEVLVAVLVIDSIVITPATCELAEVTFSFQGSGSSSMR